MYKPLHPPQRLISHFHASFVTMVEKGEYLGFLFLLDDGQMEPSDAKRAIWGSLQWLSMTVSVYWSRSNG